MRNQKKYDPKLLQREFTYEVLKLAVDNRLQSVSIKNLLDEYLLNTEYIFETRANIYTVQTQLYFSLEGLVRNGYIDSPNYAELSSNGYLKTGPGGRENIIVHVKNIDKCKGERDELKKEIDEANLPVKKKFKAKPVNNLSDVFYSNAINQFLDIEDRFLEDNYLNENYTWLLIQKKLVALCYILQERGYCKTDKATQRTHFNKIIKCFAERYSCNIEDMAKPSKFKCNDVAGYYSDYYFIEKIE